MCKRRLTEKLAWLWNLRRNTISNFLPLPLIFKCPLALKNRIIGHIGENPPYEMGQPLKAPLRHQLAIMVLSQCHNLSFV